jgi:hypothetical protein
MQRERRGERGKVLNLLAFLVQKELCNVKGLESEARAEAEQGRYTQFTCFTGTKVQILGEREHE